MIVARLLLLAVAIGSFLFAAPALADDRPATGQKLSTLSARCDAGKAAACLTLGTIRENDRDIDVRNFELAAQAHKAACDLGHFAGCNRLGDLYYFGRGVPRNTAISVDLYKRACAADIGEACFSHGYILSNNRGEAESGAQAAALYKKACAVGYLDACSYEADSWFSGDAGTHDPARGEAILNTSCQRGAETSCVALANRLFWGNPMPKDPSRAQALLGGNCAEKGVKSCLRMAEALQNGSDLPKDEVRAALYLEKACKLKNVEGCDLYARALHNGTGIAPNKARALTLFDWACTQESRYCESGEIIRMEPGLSKACDDGIMASCIELAQATGNTYSVLASKARALSLYARACDGGAATSCSAAADVLSDLGRNTDPAAEPSILAYRDRGCTGGDARACANLASNYQYGEAGQADEVKAATYFARACTLGETSACGSRDRLVGLAPELAIASANADQSPPADEAPQTAETVGMTCTIETTEFEGRTFEQKRCTSPVIMGFDIDPGSAPWQALIERPASLGSQRLGGTSRVLCGGSLIEKGWILTAAHCLKDEGRDIGRGGYSIRLGLFDVTKPEGISYPILQVIPHKDFVPGRRTLANDIALIQYDARAPSRKGTLFAIKTIRLDEKPVGQRSILEGMPAYTYGWGWTEAVNSQANATLKGARLALRTESDCSKITRFTGQFANVVLCAAGKKADQACYGDSGGPLVYYGDPDKIPRVIGVVSAGKSCGTRGEPSRYTRVGRVVDWIRPIVWPSARPSAR